MRRQGQRNWMNCPQMSQSINRKTEIWEKIVWLQSPHVIVLVQSLGRVWLCSLRDCSTPGFPVFHHLPDFDQTNVFESVMPSNHLILSCSLLLLPSIFSSIRIFSSEPAFCIKWLKYWSFSFSISPSHEYSGLISFRMDWLDLLAVLMTTTALHYCRSKSGEEWGRSGWTVLEQGKVLKGTWSFNKGVQDMIDTCKQFFM